MVRKHERINNVTVNVVAHEVIYTVLMHYLKCGKQFKIVVIPNYITIALDQILLGMATSPAKLRIYAPALVS